jgi:Mrp family chromosome partitioning ATPase
MLHLQERKPDIGNNLILPLPYSGNLSVVSPSFMLPSEDTPIIWRGPMKASAIRQFFTSVKWGELDYLIVDSPPGTGDEPLSVAQLMPQPAHAILVTTPQEVAIDDARRATAFCRRASLPIAGMVENMSGMACPHCGKPIDIYKRGGGRKAAAELGLNFLGEVPFDPRMVVASDKGVPFVSEFPESIAAKSISDIAVLLSKTEQHSD